MKNFYKSKFKLASLLSILILISGGMLIRQSQREKTRDVSKFIILAERGSLPRTVGASGELKSQKIVIISPKRQGILDKIYVNSGDKVEKNQLIAKMDIGNLKYRIAELQAIFDKEKSNFERRKFLFKEGAISKEKFDEYKNLYKISQARLNQLLVEKKELDVLAPFKGIVTRKFTEEGAYVAPATTFTSQREESASNSSIIELSQGLQVIAKVPESDIGRIYLDQLANIKVDPFPEKVFKAKVIEISPRAIRSNSVTSFEVKLSFFSNPSLLRIGMTSDIEFLSEQTSVETLVPTVAIVTKDGLPGVLKVDKNNQPKFQKVNLGISGGSKTSILEGVNPGDQIFIDLPPWVKRFDE